MYKIEQVSDETYSNPNTLYPIVLSWLARETSRERYDNSITVSGRFVVSGRGRFRRGDRR